MRKHKFKVWSIPEKRWINLNGFCISFNGCDDEGAVYEVTEQGVLHVIDIETVVIVEWTGLVDDERKEIYEGDIVKGKVYLRNTELFSRFIGEVKYYAPKFEIVGVNKYKNIREDLNGSFKVIGNIYENADLKGESQ